MNQHSPAHHSSPFFPMRIMRVQNKFYLSNISFHNSGKRKRKSWTHSKIDTQNWTQRSWWMNEFSKINEILAKRLARNPKVRYMWIVRMDNLPSYTRDFSKSKHVFNFPQLSNGWVDQPNGNQIFLHKLELLVSSQMHAYI